MVRAATVAIAAAALLALPLAALAGEVPDPAKTPGVARPLSKAAICSTRWGRDARRVTPAMKRDVFRRYGFTGYRDRRCVRGCEIDHLIARELGGADDVRNLWPEPYGGTWGARRKDRLENRLHTEVCLGHLALRAAQRMLVGDWRVAYRKYYGAP